MKEKKAKELFNFRKVRFFTKMKWFLNSLSKRNVKHCVGYYLLTLFCKKHGK